MEITPRLFVFFDAKKLVQKGIIVVDSMYSYERTILFFLVIKRTTIDSYISSKDAFFPPLPISELDLMARVTEH